MEKSRFKTFYTRQFYFFIWFLFILYPGSLTLWVTPLVNTGLYQQSLPNVTSFQSPTIGAPSMFVPTLYRRLLYQVPFYCDETLFSNSSIAPQIESSLSMCLFFCLPLFYIKNLRLFQGSFHRFLSSYQNHSINSVVTCNKGICISINREIYLLISISLYIVYFIWIYYLFRFYYISIIYINITLISFPLTNPLHQTVSIQQKVS